MFKKLLALTLTLCLILSAGFAFADYIEEINLCVGQTYSTTYYSRGGYIGSAKPANSAIVSASAHGWSITITSYLQYGSEATFTGLAAGSTTVSFYTEYGSWMGSVKVNVSAHKWEKSVAYSFSKIEGSDEYFLSEVCSTKTCTKCGATETDVQSFEPEEGVTLAEVYEYIGINDKDDAAIALNARLKELNYTEEELDDRFSSKSQKAFRKFMSEIGLNEKYTTVSPEAQQALFSAAAPKKGEGLGEIEIGSDDNETLEIGVTGVETLNTRLMDLGYLGDDGLGDIYAESTARAITLMQMKLGYPNANGKADMVLMALIFNGNQDALKISPEEYEALSAQIDDALALIAPVYKVQVTAGSNLRTKPSYEGDKVTWVNEGDILEYIDEQNGWYQVTAPDGKTGYIPADRSKLIEE